MYKSKFNIFFIIFIVLIPILILAQTDNQMERLYEMSEKDSAIKIRWDKKTGSPARLQGTLTQSLEGDAKQIAMEFFKINKELYGIQAADEELEVTNVKKDDRGWEHVTIQQVFKKLPVEGKEIKVHINKNREVQVVNGLYLPNVDVSITPAINEQEAVSAAKKAINPKSDSPNGPKTTLMVYNFDNKNYLVWKVQVYFEDPLGDFIYYIDAQTGNVIDSYNNLKFNRNRNTYDANHHTSLPGTLRRSENGAATNDAALDAAHDNAGAVYNYYNNTFGRDSYDDNGATLNSTVHYSSNYNNAFWNGSQMVYGDGDGSTFSPLSEALDVVGHELTHAVTENESNLVYRNQSGALNESISDIFGVLMDPGDWMVGEDVYTPGTAGDALRYMDDPTRGGQPDHMSNYVNTTSDNGGVHTNSGIPNKAAYLMSEGGTHHGITVLGFGRNTMGQVFYETQVHWLTSNADFTDARDATLDAVAALFPGDMSKNNTVQNAWAAVGVGLPAGLALELSPSPLNVKKNGGTKTLNAKVTENGTPVSGATLSFSTANSSRATISQATATTDASGNASVVVTGHNKGYTTVSAIAQSGSNATNAAVQVKVPVTSWLGILILILMIGFVVYFYQKKATAN